MTNGLLVEHSLLVILLACIMFRGRRREPRIKESFSAEVNAKHSLVRQIHRKQVVAFGWEPQNNSPTACVWRWDQKN